MANLALRDALAAQSITAQRLAEAVGVDEKTVGRWLTDEQRVPHQRHRWATCTLLEVDEVAIWPSLVRTSLKTGADREVVACYPYRSAVPRTLWRKLIEGSGRALTFGGYTNYFLWMEMPNLNGLLTRKARAGVDVRFLMGDKDSPVTAERERIEAVPLTVTTRINIALAEIAKLDHPRIHTRFSDKHISMSIFRFDDDMLVCTHLADLLGHDSPTMHIKKRQDEGLFDRYAKHLTFLWEEASPTP